MDRASHYRKVRAQMRRFALLFAIVTLGISALAAADQFFKLGLGYDWKAVVAGPCMALFGFIILWVGNKISDFVERIYP